jgi:hypothetical protein
MLPVLPIIIPRFFNFYSSEFIVTCHIPYLRELFTY